ncbi:hypothetical protein [Rheinheimera sp. EpRS3]|uniref:hypothetical protein n=1 Tax=Rheinheimera sp. EpRS3 TaxID=1712383 RepID=UPI001E453DF9|nr:hypothetical protein [Rheinheimera sp. EpRS3]
MPVTGRHTQMFCHGFTEDFFTGVVMFKCEGIGAISTFIGDFIYLIEILSHAALLGFAHNAAGVMLGNDAVYHNYVFSEPSCAFQHIAVIIAAVALLAACIRSNHIVYYAHGAHPLAAWLQQQ